MTLTVAPDRLFSANPEDDWIKPPDCDTHSFKTPDEFVSIQSVYRNLKPPRDLKEEDKIEYLFRPIVEGNQPSDSDDEHHSNPPLASARGESVGNANKTKKRGPWHAPISNLIKLFRPKSDPDKDSRRSGSPPPKEEAIKNDRLPETSWIS